MFSKRSLSITGSTLALVLATGGVAAAQNNWMPRNHPDARQDIQLINHLAPTLTVGNAMKLGGKPAAWYAAGAQHAPSSGGEKFLMAGQTVKLGKVGHFTFSASCTKVDGQNQATFDVTADTTAALDGNAPVAAGNLVNIHTNSDALDTTQDAPLNAGDFDQVGSASDSTEIAADGQEVDVFYNDGVNWPAGNGSAAHDCFAGYTGFLG
jgi:hypothetical protein